MVDSPIYHTWSFSLDTYQPPKDTTGHELQLFWLECHYSPAFQWEYPWLWHPGSHSIHQLLYGSVSEECLTMTQYMNRPCQVRSTSAHLHAVWTDSEPQFSPSTRGCTKFSAKAISQNLAGIIHIVNVFKEDKYLLEHPMIWQEMHHICTTEKRFQFCALD